MKLIMAALLGASVLWGVDLASLDAQRDGVGEGVITVYVSSDTPRGQEENIYVILRKNADESLALFMHESERGTVVLKQKGNLYIKTPRSKRAVRIVPIQRLFGDASFGDILELTFADNYTISKQEGDMVYLKAKDDDATYNTIEVELKNGILYKSALKSFSGKTLKTVYYQKKESKLFNYYRFVGQKGESMVWNKSFKSIQIPSSLLNKRSLKDAFKKAQKLL